jgi:hypothetical protein
MLLRDHRILESDNSMHINAPPKPELKLYKFKAPAFLRKLTNTYFKTS